MDKKQQSKKGDRGQPMEEPRKSHGDKIRPDDEPTAGDMAQKPRDKMQQQEKAEGERRR